LATHSKTHLYLFHPRLKTATAIKNFGSTFIQSFLAL